jgi:hypothetical protein
MALPVDVDLSTAALILCGDQARCSNCKHQRKQPASLAAKPKILLEKIVCLELLLPWIAFAAIELYTVFAMCGKRKEVDSLAGAAITCSLHARSSSWEDDRGRIILGGGVVNGGAGASCSYSTE